MTVNRKLYDWAIARTTITDEMAEEIARKVGEFLYNQVLPDIAAKLEGLPFNMLSGNDFRLLALRDAIRTGAGWDRLTALAFRELSGMSMTESEAVKAVLDSLLSPIGFNTILPGPDLIAAIVTDEPFNGRLLTEWFSDLGETMQNNLYRSLRVGMAEGEDLRTLAKGLRSYDPEVFVGGSGNIVANSMAVAKTAAQSVAMRAREMTYEQNSDVIASVEYVAELDDHTTLLCLSLHGTVWPIDEGPRPPQHFNCRSQTIPVVKSWEDMGIDIPDDFKVELDGEPAKESGLEWLEDQNKETQAAVLGPVRQDLYASGQLSFKDMLGSDGTLTTLKDLGYTMAGAEL